jgi:hypothetical protein
MNGSKEGGHRRGSQDYIAGDLIGRLLIDRMASEDSELTGSHVRGANQQARRS